MSFNYFAACTNIDQDAKKKRIEEQQKYGVFFEDDYDYLQHLKESDEVYELEPVEEKVSVPADRKEVGTFHGLIQ